MAKAKIDVNFKYNEAEILGDKIAASMARSLKDKGLSLAEIWIDASASFGRDAADALFSNIKKQRIAERMGEAHIAVLAAGAKYAPTLAGRMRYRAARVGARFKAAGGLKGLAATGASKGAMGAAGIVAGVGGAYGAAATMAMDLGAKANPAIMEQMMLALEDLGAVAGTVLLPILDMMTVRFQLLGDFLASILPSQQEMNTIMEAMKPAFDATREVLELVAPLIHTVLVGALKTAVFVIKILANVFIFLVDVILFAINAITLGMLGIKRGAGDKLVSSVGAGGRGGQYSGLEEYGKALQLSAFQTGIDPMMRTAIATEKAAGILDTRMEKTNKENVGDKRAIDGFA